MRQSFISRNMHRCKNRGSRAFSCMDGENCDGIEPLCFPVDLTGLGECKKAYGQKTYHILKVPSEWWQWKIFPHGFAEIVGILGSDNTFGADEANDVEQLSLTVGVSGVVVGKVFFKNGLVSSFEPLP